MPTHNIWRKVRFDWFVRLCAKLKKLWQTADSLNSFRKFYDYSLFLPWRLLAGAAHCFP